MIRGTTPIHTFTLPLETSLIKDLRVIYAQNDVVIVTKMMEDCLLEGSTITLELSQEDSLSFSDRVPVQIQLRVLTTSGHSLTSYIQTVPVEKCLSDEVLT